MNFYCTHCFLTVPLGTVLSNPVCYVKGNGETIEHNLIVNQTQPSAGNLEKEIRKIIERDYQKYFLERPVDFTAAPIFYAEYYQRLVIWDCPASSIFNISKSSLPFNLNPFGKSFGRFMKRIEQAGQSNKEGRLQDAWFQHGDWCQYFDIKDFTSEMYDTRRSPLLGSIRPDVVHIVRGFQPSEAVVVAVGLLKRPVISQKEEKTKEDIFPSDEQGRVLHLAKLIYLANPYRRPYGVISYLSDGVMIQFYRYCGEHDIGRSPPMRLRDHGGRWLFGLMTTPLKRFGMPVPQQVSFEGKKLNLESVLGIGGFGVVYKCTTETKDEFALKYFDDEEEAVKEIEALKAVRNSIRSNNFLIEPLNLTEDDKGLLLSPICRDISTPSTFSGYDKLQLQQLIVVVRELHNAGWVHRDLKPPNILIQHNGDICLTDFSTCVRMNESHQYSGATKFASDNILQQLKLSPYELPVLTARTNDDYASLVKLCYISVFTGCYKSLKRIRSTSYDDMEEFWASKLSAETWKNLLNQSYDELLNFIDSIFPERV